VIVDRFGWSLAHGFISATVFRLWWYLLGLFLWNASSFFLIESMSFLMALLKMVVMAVLQSAGISGIDGCLSSLRNSVAIVGSPVSAPGRLEVVVWDLLVLTWLIVRFFRRVMRLICLFFDLLIGVCNLVCCGAVGGWVMGHMDWARLCYCVKVCITSLAALSMSLMVLSVETLMEASRFWASSRAHFVASSPSW